MNILDVLGDDGLFSKAIPDFHPRQAQIEMAQRIGDAIASRELLVCEAGTGTGKTFAYLVPALLSGRKVIISTGTKTLQDQLFHRDLPSVLQTLKKLPKVALLKGRSNYLCHYRFMQADAAVFDTVLQSQLAHIHQWLPTTDSGDIAECREIAEDSRVWPIVTSTVDNCLGSDCSCYQSCFVMQARRQAQESDLLVINHHLFFVDLALRGEGFGEVLPDADVVIFDEAHQVPDIARQYFGEALSSRRISEVISDVDREFDVLQEKHDRLLAAADELQSIMHRVKQSLGRPGQRSVLVSPEQRPGLSDSLQDLNKALQQYAELLEQESERSTGLERCYQRVLDIDARLQFFQRERQDDSDSWIHWYETHERRFVLHNTPVDVADIMRNHLDLHHRAWVFTSATLSVNGQFDHFIDELGLQGAHCANWESPFPFQENALLYLPKQLPEPNHPRFHERLLEICLPLIHKLRGATFILVTSYDALHKMKALLQAHGDFQLLVQGEYPKAELLQRFRSSENAILLGTASFWEGVDVKGAALSCVIIDKLPFAAPSDPVLQARIKQIQENGGNGFMAIQIPQAVLRLKQGAGRLIRDEHDKGILVIADPRISKQRYGALFLKSLPAMRRSDQLDEALAFVEEELCIC